MDSILVSIKKMLGISEDVKIFDADIIIHINSVFMILNQLGVGPSKGFSITDATSTWSEFIPNESSIEAVKSYVYLKVRLLFDPPTSSAAIESYNKMIAEFEWRINVMVETGEIVSTETEDLKNRVTNLENKMDNQDKAIIDLEKRVSDHDELFETLVGVNDE